MLPKRSCVIIRLKGEVLWSLSLSWSVEIKFSLQIQRSGESICAAHFWRIVRDRFGHREFDLGGGGRWGGCTGWDGLN
jgi:hypothetical protein